MDVSHLHHTRSVCASTELMTPKHSSAIILPGSGALTNCYLALASTPNRAINTYQKWQSVKYLPLQKSWLRPLYFGFSCHLVLGRFYCFFQCFFSYRPDLKILFIYFFPRAAGLKIPTGPENLMIKLVWPKM